MEIEVKKLEEEFERDLLTAQAPSDIEALGIKYLGRKAEINRLFSMVPSLNKEEKGIWGKNLNILKNKITFALSEKSKSLSAKEEKIDLTYPASRLTRGSRHILNVVSEEICSVFEKLGFTVVEGTEIEDEWHNFSALNIPLDHPSRDAFDTFYLDIPEPKEKNRGKFLLRSHTSPSQARVMRLSKPPIAVVSPGRVYRPDAVDASHSFMFHQVEGFAIDKNINFAHLKGVLLNFARLFFSPDVNLRLRPHFFPFTEPSAEVDISCFICKGKKDKCSLCKGKGWLEILGCGMIHPKVLENCGIDSKKYKGFAFGMGVERPAMLKYGINDIRLFYENDVKFLEQF
ncbi:MAG: phenylalanine--tRNA ligase subunit alpha [Candidatus Omnitrophica bacterium]|nr:phenylalanine--tRNA ligase subunit alpha [Candidatus Omnitrophota bacterium]